MKTKLAMIDVLISVLHFLGDTMRFLTGGVFYWLADVASSFKVKLIHTSVQNTPAKRVLQSQLLAARDSDKPLKISFQQFKSNRRRKVLVGGSEEQMSNHRIENMATPTLDQDTNKTN